MLLSIIIPTYNRAHLIEHTLKSVLNQTRQDYEVIVVDDGSTDHTEAVVAPYLSERVSYVKIANSERGAARNKGTQLAKGTYVNWFDSDDEMLPNHVEEVNLLVEKCQTPEVITLFYSFKDSRTGKITPIQFDYLGAKNTKHYLIEGNYLACNPVIVRRDIALANPFIEDRNLSASEDYELWLRLLAQFNFCQSPKVTSYLIQHDERSVVTMTNPDKLEKRFLAFLKYTTENTKFKLYLGKDFHYFVMRNYLVLAVDLAFNKHKKLARKYVILAMKKSRKVWSQRLFYATLKHLLFK